MNYFSFDFKSQSTLSTEEIVIRAKALIEIYPCDLEDAFIDEFLLFSRMFADSKSVAEMISSQIADKLVSSFPNVNIAFRI